MAAIANSDVRLVAWSNSPAPELGSGLQFTSISQYPPRLDHLGRTVFTGRLDDPNGISPSIHGILRESSPGQLEVVAQVGERVSGAGPDAAFTSLRIPKVNGNGRVVFGGVIEGTGVDTITNQGIWREGSGGLELVVRDGNSPPTTPPGVVFDAPLFFDHRIDDSGRVVFISAIAGPGVTDANDQGIWGTTADGELERVVLNGTTPTGVDPLVKLDFVRAPDLSNSGMVVFWAALTGPGVNDSNDRGIWTRINDDPLQLVAREGDSVPGQVPGVVYHAVHLPSINNSGHLAFNATFAGSGIPFGTGIFSDRGGNGFEIAVSRGDPVPGLGAGVEFDAFEHYEINDLGHLGFNARIDGPGVGHNDTAHLTEAPGAGIQLVAREGEHAPGTPSGVVFDELLTPSVLNSSGQLAFLGYLTDAAGGFGSQGNGIWAQDPNGQLQLIARTGDLLNVSLDPLTPDFRTISRFRFADDTGNGDGRPTGFNNRGQVAFWAAFTDGSEGVFISNQVAVPEPASFFFALIASLSMLAKLRSK